MQKQFKRVGAMILLGAALVLMTQTGEAFCKSSRSNAHKDDKLIFNPYGIGKYHTGFRIYTH